MIPKHAGIREVPLVTYGLSLVTFFSAHIAQSAEHFLGKEEVIGSIPIMGSKVETLRPVFCIQQLLSS